LTRGGIRLGLLGQKGKGGETEVVDFTITLIKKLRGRGEGETIKYSKQESKPGMDGGESVAWGAQQIEGGKA